MLQIQLVLCLSSFWGGGRFVVLVNTLGAVKLQWIAFQAFCLVKIFNIIAQKNF